MLTLPYRSTTSIPVEAECVTPDNLAGKTLVEIAACGLASDPSRLSAAHAPHDTLISLFSRAARLVNVVKPDRVSHDSLS
jgi:hypothetical protein